MSSDRGGGGGGGRVWHLVERFRRDMSSLISCYNDVAIRSKMRDAVLVR